MLRRIVHELQHHVLFTFTGTVLGVAVLLGMVFAHVPGDVSHRLFEVAHPLHVLLSAMVTAGMYRLHGRGRWWATILIGYVGSIGIATLSDCVIPYVGEVLMRMEHAHPHIGFIEEWYVVNPLAFLGIAIAFRWPRTKFPHAGHVLISTAASLFHMTTAMSTDWTTGMIFTTAVFLFLAVWVPCCTSDIIFPLLFVPPEHRPPCEHCHKHESEKTKSH
ncbi:MAG: hypothetical protein JXA11_14295 [Phycisphaerae bacterium]|nr:hypothetical protein [Phycisphaerae bacterium]